MRAVEHTYKPAVHGDYFLLLFCLVNRHAAVYGRVRVFSKLTYTYKPVIHYGLKPTNLTLVANF